MYNYRDNKGKMDPSIKQNVKFDPVSGRPMGKNQVKPKPQVQPKQAGLGNNELLAKAMNSQEQYQNDKNKNNGLNLNSSLNSIGNITSSITN